MTRQKESGAVSLFSVVMSMLLITVITIGFVRLMVADQQQSSNNDLSNSAYDSSQAGVEDAKRVLLRYKQVCGAGGSPTECASLRTMIPSDICNEVISRSGVTGSTLPSQAKYPEVPIQSRTGGSADGVYDQAYTCVTMKLQSPNYEASVGANGSTVIPLKGASTFDTVQVQWFSRDDVSTGSVNLPTLGARNYLQSAWPQNRPSVLRTQLMQYGSSFTMENFDATVGGRSNTNTLFLFPVRGTIANNYAFTDRDVRANSAMSEPPKDDAGNSPLPVSCVATVASSADYSCTATLTLPQPYNGNADNSNRSAYLRLAAFYNASHFRVTLYNGPTQVNFNEVQAVVDSTGRANDLFRRVESRVNMFDTDLPFPEAAVDVTGNFCKDFSVTDTQYFAGSCTP